MSTATPHKKRLILYCLEDKHILYNKFHPLPSLGKGEGGMFNGERRQRYYDFLSALCCKSAISSQIVKH